MVPTVSRSSSRRAGAGRKPAQGRETTVAGLTDRLTAIGVTPHWVVSCYLKLEPRDRGRGKYLIKLKNRAKRLTAGLEGAGLTRAERAQVEGDVERIRDELSDVAVVEHMPKLEGRQMIMVLAPKRK